MFTPLERVNLVYTLIKPNPGDEYRGSRTLREDLPSAEFVPLSSAAVGEWTVSVVDSVSGDTGNVTCFVSENTNHCYDDDYDDVL